jgi:hypothetical protein
MRRAAFFILSIFRDIAIRVAITLLILAAVWGSLKYYFSGVCISGFGTYSQACIDGAAARDLPDKSRKDQ